MEFLLRIKYKLHFDYWIFLKQEFDLYKFQFEKDLELKWNQIFPNGKNLTFQMIKGSRISYLMIALSFFLGIHKSGFKTINDNHYSFEKYPYLDTVSLKLSSTKDNIFGLHKIEWGDTLMKLAFDFYGDSSRWRELLKWNKNLIKGEGNSLSFGENLKFYGPKIKIPTPHGLPYLIKRGDTLSIIAMKIYGDYKMWKVIWKNNPNQIKDPNKIYAGFTIYYPSRGLASEQ